MASNLPTDLFEEYTCVWTRLPNLLWINFVVFFPLHPACIAPGSRVFLSIKIHSQSPPLLDISRQEEPLLGCLQFRFIIITLFYFFIHVDDEFDDMSEGRFQPVVDVPAIALAVFIVLINSLALIMVAKKTYLRSITNLLLCSLALSDLLTGLVSVPLFITCNIVRRLAVCLTEEQLSRFISASIVSHLMSVVIDR